MSSIITFTFCSKWNHLIYRTLTFSHFLLNVGSRLTVSYPLVILLEGSVSLVTVSHCLKYPQNFDKVILFPLLVEFPDRIIGSDPVQWSRGSNVSWMGLEKSRHPMRNSRLLFLVCFHFTTSTKGRIRNTITDPIRWHWGYHYMSLIPETNSPIHIHTSPCGSHHHGYDRNLKVTRAFRHTHVTFRPSKSWEFRAPTTT